MPAESPVGTMQLLAYAAHQASWDCPDAFPIGFIDDNIEAIPDANNIKCTSSSHGGLGKGQQCTELMSSNFHSQVLGENFVPVLVGIVILFFTVRENLRHTTMATLMTQLAGNTEAAYANFNSYGTSSLIDILDINFLT